VGFFLQACARSFEFEREILRERVRAGLAPADCPSKGGRGVRPLEQRRTSGGNAREPPNTGAVAKTLGFATGETSRLARQQKRAGQSGRPRGRRGSRAGSRLAFFVEKTGQNSRLAGYKRRLVDLTGMSAMG
jgi:hypothetical protein